VARDAILAKQVCVARNQITLFAEGAVIGLTGLLDDRRESQLARDVNSQRPLCHYLSGRQGGASQVVRLAIVRVGQNRPQ
jgi:hypothetical protein